MAVEAGNPYVAEFLRRSIQRFSLIERDAELVFLETGGNIGVGFRIHIRVHPQAHRRNPVHFASHAVQHMQLRFRFHVEAQYAYCERRFHFRRLLAHT